MKCQKSRLYNRHKAELSHYASRRNRLEWFHLNRDAIAFANLASICIRLITKSTVKSASYLQALCRFFAFAKLAAQSIDLETMFASHLTHYWWTDRLTLAYIATFGVLFEAIRTELEAHNSWTNGWFDWTMTIRTTSFYAHLASKWTFVWNRRANRLTRAFYAAFHKCAFTHSTTGAVDFGANGRHLIWDTFTTEFIASIFRLVCLL